MTQILEMETNEIEVPKEMLTKVPKQKKAMAYALSRNTLGIAFKPNRDWANKSLWKGEIELKETETSIIAILPKSVSSFYQIKPSNITISVAQKTNTLMINIS